MVAAVKAGAAVAIHDMHRLPIILLEVLLVFPRYFVRDGYGIFVANPTINGRGQSKSHGLAALSPYSQVAQGGFA